MSTDTIERRVRDAVARATGRDVSAEPVKRLAGHASMRSYWRVGAFPDSLVVMVMPPDAKPEEITNGGAPAVDPFLDVQAYLERLGVRVPAVGGGPAGRPPRGPPHRRGDRAAQRG